MSILIRGNMFTMLELIFMFTFGLLFIVPVALIVSLILFVITDIIVNKQFEKKYKRRLK